MSPRTFALALFAVWFLLLAKSLEFEPPYFRPWEALRRGPVAFAPNRRMDREEIGALGYRSWVRSLQLPHRTVFSTDRWGFRNEVDLPSPAVVMTGDSFVVGLGVSDDETLPARLTEYLGTPVYNYGGESAEVMRYFLADPRFAAAPPRLVLWAQVDPAYPIPLPPRAGEGGTGAGAPEPQGGALRARLEPAFGVFRSVGVRLDNTRLFLERDNGLGRFAKHTYHEVKFALFGHDALIEVDGGWALVKSLEEQRLFQDMSARRLDETVASYAAFRDALGERGIRLVVVPLPDTGSLYPDHFPERERARLVTPTFREQFLARLSEQGVDAIDLLPELHAARTPYLFIRDDTHWNPRALDLAARVIARELPRLLAP